MKPKIIWLATLVTVSACLHCPADETTAKRTMSSVVAAIDRDLSKIEELTDGQCSHELSAIRHSVNELIILAKAAARDGSSEQADFARAIDALAKFDEERASRNKLETPKRVRPETGEPDSTRREFPGDFSSDPKAAKPKEEEDKEEAGSSAADKARKIRDQHEEQIKKFNEQKEKGQAETNTDFENRLDEAKSSRDALDKFAKDVEEANNRKSLTASQAKTLLTSARGHIKTLEGESKMRHQLKAAHDFENQIENTTSVERLKQLRTTIRIARGKDRISDAQSTSLLGKIETAITALTSESK